MSEKNRVIARAWTSDGTASITFNLTYGLQLLTDDELKKIIYHDEMLLYKCLILVSEKDNKLKKFLEFTQSLNYFKCSKELRVDFNPKELIKWIKYNRSHIMNNCHNIMNKVLDHESRKINLSNGIFPKTKLRVHTEQWHHWVIEDLNFQIKHINDAKRNLYILSQFTNDPVTLQESLKNCPLVLSQGWCRSSENYITPWNFAINNKYYHIGIQLIQSLMLQYNIDGVIALLIGENINVYNLRGMQKFSIISKNMSHLIGNDLKENVSEWKNILFPPIYKRLIYNCDNKDCFKEKPK